jgi:hypothetical protein
MEAFVDTFRIPSPAALSHREQPAADIIMSVSLPIQ